MHLTDPESNDLKLFDGENTISSGSGTAAAEFKERQSLGGRYQVISCLGKGGMGLVYRVNQIFLNKEFALKTIEKNCLSDVAIRRFQREARTTFALDHPNIVAVNDFGVLDDQTPFLVMELVAGETLGERLKKTGSLTVEQAIPIFVQVCFGLAYAHDSGVVHRDIKPNNIMLLKGLPLGSEGSVKILDFGIAKFTAHEEGEMQALTRTGEIFGSPLYMSPEQCSGFSVDHRSDIYSLGCVLFEALTGTPPFIGENALATMMKHQGDRAPTLKEASMGTEFPQAIEQIVATMLAKSPEARYNNLGIVAHDLDALRRGDSISPFNPARTIPKKEAATITLAKVHFYALIIGTALLSTTVSGFLGYTLHTADESKIEQPNEEKPLAAQSKLTENAKPGENLEELLVIPALTPQELQLRFPTKDKSLSVSYKTINDNVFDVIAAASWIEDLSLNNSIFKNENLAKLSALKKLKEIDLSGSSLNDIGAEGIAQCQELIGINAAATHLSEKGLRTLASMKKLHLLTLSNTGLSARELVALAKSTTLYNLNIEGLKLPESDMLYIRTIPELTTIGLNKTNVTVRGVEELCKNKNVRTIWLQNCPNISAKELIDLKSKYKRVDFR